MATVFDHHAARGNEILHYISAELDLSFDDAARVLVTVLQSFRRQLGTEQAAQLMQWMPSIIRGIFVEQWDPQREPCDGSLEEFLKSAAPSENFLPPEINAQMAAGAVFRALYLQLPPGDFEKMIPVLPIFFRHYLFECLASPAMNLHRELSETLNR